MGMVIGTNVASLSAQRHLAESRGDLETSMERLASGSRINSSRDDAAGLAISGRMESQVNGLNQAVRNANDGIALAQSAEGALDETTAILQRMRDLSVQASSDTLTSSDRDSIQAEVSQLTTELDRIADTTQFNSKNLLDGSHGTFKFQVGASEGQSVTLDIGASGAADLGLTGSISSGDASALNGGRMSSLETLAGDDISINGVDWVANGGAVVSTAVTVNDANGTSVSAATTTAAGVAEIINAGTSAHGATATASNSVLSTAASGVTSGLTIGGATISDSANVAELVTNINNEASNAKARLIDSSHFELYNDTGEDIVVAGTVTNSGLSSATNIGFLSLSNTDGSKTVLSTGDNTSAAVADVNSMGFNARTSASTIVGSSVSASTDIALTDDLTINGVSIGPSDNNGQPSAANLATHLNTYTASTHVQASAHTEVTLAMDTTMSGGAASSTNASTDAITINGLAITLGSGTDAISDIATTINTALSGAGMGGIEAVADGSNLILTSVSGETISITDTDSNVSQFTRDDGSTVSATASLTDFTGQLTLTNTKGGDVLFGTVNGTEAELDTSLALLGLHQQGEMSQSATSSGLSMASSAMANAAITAIDAALEKVFVSRGDLGAFQNRLDHTVSNLRNVSENMSFSRSQIMDSDFAAESANLAKAQVLQQAGTAMLAQANASTQNVLSLLK